MTQSSIYQMLKDLGEHKRSKETLLRVFIENRLNKCLETYYDDITSSYESLKQKNEIHILRKLNKV